MTLTKKITFTSAFAALICVATMVIHVPTPTYGGYVNIGDSIIFIAGALLNPFLALAAGGVGSALADIILGYTIYAPFTLIIKGLEGFIVSCLFRLLKKKDTSFTLKLVYLTLCCVIAAVEMVLGYFFTHLILYKNALGALIATTNDFMQVGISIAIAIPLYVGLVKAKAEKFFEDKRGLHMNIFDDRNKIKNQELVELIYDSPNAKVEKIISQGEVSPDGFWYDQEQNETVILLNGKAKIEFENGDIITLRKGDTILIKKHNKHRIIYTSKIFKCIWVCLFSE